ncbi:MAG: hypothetical protein ACK5KO_13625 [Arachnia sp.]
MTKTNEAVAAAESVTADAFHQILDLAITGRGALPGAKAAANAHLERRGNPETAISWLVNQHIALAGGQGFATNWGGLLTSIVTIPVNVAAATFVQARMVAGVAHLRGYELSDPRVRTAIGMCMLGPLATKQLIRRGVLPSSPGAVATAPVFDAELDRQVGRALLDRALNELGGKRLGVWAAKRVPVLGAGVGAAVDSWSTHAISRHAVEALPSRRPRLSAWAETGQAQRSE